MHQSRMLRFPVCELLQKCSVNYALTMRVFAHFILRPLIRIRKNTTTTTHERDSTPTAAGNSLTNLRNFKYYFCRESARNEESVPEIRYTHEMRCAAHFLVSVGVMSAFRTYLCSFVALTNESRLFSSAKFDQAREHAKRSPSELTEGLDGHFVRASSFFTGYECQVSNALYLRTSDDRELVRYLVFLFSTSWNSSHFIHKSDSDCMKKELGFGKSTNIDGYRSFTGLSVR